MDQTELIEDIAKELGISNAQSKRLLKATLREIRDLLKAGHSVSLPDLGTFDTTTYKESAVICLVTIILYFSQNDAFRYFAQEHLFVKRFTI